MCQNRAGSIYVPDVFARFGAGPADADAESEAAYCNNSTPAAMCWLLRNTGILMLPLNAPARTSNDTSTDSRLTLLSALSAVNWTHENGIKKQGSSASFFPDGVACLGLIQTFFVNSGMMISMPSFGTAAPTQTIQESGTNVNSPFRSVVAMDIVKLEQYLAFWRLHNLLGAANSALRIIRSGWREGDNVSTKKMWQHLGLERRLCDASPRLVRCDDLHSLLLVALELGQHG